MLAQFVPRLELLILSCSLKCTFFTYSDMSYELNTNIHVNCNQSVNEHVYSQKADMALIIK